VFGLGGQTEAVGLEQDVAIPQIAVVGDQSAGKSSVLEAISGIPFPRGSGLVTRCATQIIMKRCHVDEWSGYISILWKDNPDRPQPDICGPIEIDEVGDRINELTQLIIGPDGDFSDHTISIEVQSPSVPDLTIVDLPGIIRTTTQGQDPATIEKVNSLIEDYISRERTVILAVIPSNVDIATVGILELAKNHDPQGQRTIGVLTKPDLVDKGAE